MGVNLAEWYDVWLDTNDADRSMSAPTSSQTTTSGNMLDPNDRNRSDQSSVGTPNSTQMDNFDFMVVPPDPLAFLMNTSGSDFSGDSSTEDSYRGTSTPPSSHGSPSCSAALPVQSKPIDASAFSFLTQQAFDDGLEFPVDLGGDFSGMDYSIFNSPMFSNGVVGANTSSNSQGANQYTPAGPTAFDKPAYLFNFSQAAAATPAAQFQGQQRTGGLLQPPEQHFSDVSSNSSQASTASSPLMNPSPFVTAATSSTTLPNPASEGGNESQLSGNPAIADMVQRVRALVDMNMALPAANTAPEQPKVPIPRLQRPTQAAPASAKRKQTTPPTSTPAPFSTPAFAATAPAPAPPRTKTAHTTIERRYRTNINARIQSLRAAVPALRVLEERAGNRIGNLNIKGDAVDIIDERGYVDGVKVARKGSKANVLGKAVEYIHVLKRRELRLTREKEGLRTLICSLAGGAGLLKEWETMWVEQFGGPEMDEAQNAEQGEADDENDDDDEDGEDADDGDDGASKKRKRSAGDFSGVKVRKESKANAVSPHPAAAATNAAFSVIAPGQTEKRKRGRPRKLPLPSVAPNPVASVPADVNMNLDALYGATSSLMDTSMAEQFLEQQRRNQMAQYQPGQYLLAAFAFFSFFNSPISYYATARSKHGDGHTHTGIVLDSGHDHHARDGRSWMSARALDGFGWRDVVQVVHVAVSLLLLLSIVGPWLPVGLRRRCARAMPRSFRPFLGLSYSARPGVNPSKRSRSRDSQRSSSDTSEEEKEDTSARETLSSALVYSGSNAQQATRVLRNALGLGPGLFGMCSAVLQVVFARAPGLHRLERRVLEQRAFTRLAELVALDVTASTTARIQTYVYASKFISASSASASDLATIALVIQPIWATKASALWDMALARIHRKVNFHEAKPYEKLVLEGMSVDEAMERIRSAGVVLLQSSSPRTSLDSDEESERDRDDSASGTLAVLAKQLVLEFIRARAEEKFVQLVLDVDPEETEVQSEEPKISDKRSVDLEQRSLHVVAAGKSLDRSTKALVAMYSRTCNSLATPTSSVYEELDEEISDDEEPEEDDRSADECEISCLLRSIELYQQLFPSLLVKDLSSSRSLDYDLLSSQPPRAQPPVAISLTPMPSPPPSPSRRNIDALTSTSLSYLSLRRRLASPAFDRSDILEDARDHVVEALEYRSLKDIRGY